MPSTFISGTSMTALDIGVIIVAVFLLARGIWVGFIRQIAFLLALFLGYVAAGTYYPAWSRHLSKIGNPQLRFVVTYALLFFTTYVVIMLLGLGLKKVVQISFLGWFDRLMGAVFGLGKAIFITTLVFMALTGILSSNSVFIEKAFFSKYLTISSQWITSIIKDKDLQAELLSKKPVLSDFFSDPVPILQTLGRDTK
jgi:membrane protein required for colicin V production